MRTYYPAVVALLVVTSAGRADTPPSLTDTVRGAVAARNVDDSDNVHRATFRDVASDGSVLVGLEVGLAEWFDSEIPYAVRPIFRRGTREWVGGTAGNFGSRGIVRTQQVVARPGYAVGGMWVRTGAGMDRLCLNYFKVTDAGLDPADSYTSPWVGTSDGGSDTYIDGKGRPIVGLLSDATRDQARNLGIVTARVPPVPRKPEPKAEPAAKAEPKAAKVEPRADEPAAGGRKKSKLEEEAPPPEEDDDSSLLMLGLLAVCLAVGVPAGIFGLVSMGKKDRRRDWPDDDDRPRPRRRRPDGDRRPRERPREEPAGAEALAVTAEPRGDRPELARRVAPYAARPVAAAAGIDAPKGEAPPYFLVRATYRARHSRMTRVYVTPGELLVIDCGPGADMNNAAGMAAAVLSGGGLIGGLIGGAVGSMVADAGRAKGEAIQQRLNRLDLAGVMEVAEAAGNFRARVVDLIGVTIDPPTTRAASMFTRRQAKSRAVGTFRFRELKRGEFTFEFLNGAEVRGAVELLRRALGGGLRIGQGWDEATAVYLAGL
jgi:hypothetical protein